MNTSSNGTDIDQLLRSFFRRVMPARWPAAPDFEAITVASSGQSLAASRLLVGVSLAALLALYIGLASYFPRDHVSGLNPNGGPVIGQRPGVVVPKAPQAPAIHP